MKTIFLSFTISDSSLTEYFVSLSNKLSKKYRVVVITDRVEPHNFEIESAIIVCQWPSGRPVKFRDFVFALKKIREYSPVMMISMFGSMNIFLIAGFLSRVKNRIAWCHSLYEKTPETRWRDLRKKFIYKLATTAVANSRATQNDLVANFDVPIDKTMLVPNAVRDPGINNQNAKQELVFAGRLQKLKGLDTLLEAMPEIIGAHPNVRLTVVGGQPGGKAIRDYSEKCAALGISNYVDFAGRKNKRGVLEAFSTAYCVVVPSLMEAFGLVVIESFSVATPVVGSDSSGIAETIRDGIDGYLFETGNPESLAQKINQLLADRNLRETFSVNCHQRFLDRYELGAAIDKLFLRLDSLT